VLDSEIDHILRLGITAVTGQRLGTDFTLEDLAAQGFGAVFLGIGAHSGQKLGIPGSENGVGVVDAVELLRQVNLGRMEAPGRCVVIVGGGTWPSMRRVPPCAWAASR